MTICYFGMYARNYSRNRILLKGLSQHKVNVIECNDRSHFLFGLRYLKLISKYVKLKAWDAKVLFVGFPGQTDVPLAWLIGKIFHQKIVFDAFFSLYVSQTFDRKHVTPGSLKSIGYWLVDWLGCFLSDLITLDTNAHINFFVRTFHQSPKKFLRVLVGTDTEIFKPKKLKRHTGVTIGFHGSYLPLQGAPIIIQTAKLLKSRKFKFMLLGNGIEKAKCERLVKTEKITNVEFLNEVPYEKLPDFIAKTDICLGGPFGASLKSNQVIPNKVYECLAMKKPIIVGQSNALKELLTHKINCYEVGQGSPRKLAAAILDLAKNPKLRAKIASAGYNLAISNLTPKKITIGLVQQFSVI